MDRIVQQCEGVIGISDDLIIYEEMEQEHDRRVLAFLKVAHKEGLMLNSKKCTIKANQVAFLGRIYMDKGVLPDPKKVEDIANMLTLQDTGEFWHS